MNVNDLLGSHDFFITGASGFIGTFLLYKLLIIRKRQKNDRKIFVLLRNSKEHKNVECRLRDEVISNVVFDEIRKDIESMVGKTLIAIEGDITREKSFGICDEDMKKLASKDNKLMFIHCAADIQFDRPLNVAMQINVSGSYECVKLAEKCNTVGFLHVSTLYANSRMKRDSVVKEQLYETELNGVAVFEEWEKCNRNFDTKKITQLMCPDEGNVWPNTYTLTKNIAEKVVIAHCKKAKMPLAITRLGIVSPCYREHPGWFVGNGGFVFVGIGAATGHLRYFNGDGRGRPDLVPVDFTVNGILGACTDMIATKQQQEQEEEQKEEEPQSDTYCIYQLGIAHKEPEDWGWDKLFAYTAPRFRAENFTETAPGYVHFIPNKHLFACVEWILLDLPLLFGRPVEWFLTSCCGGGGGANSETQPKLSRKIAFLRKAREKMRWLNENYTYFMNGRWGFDHTNVVALFDRLDESSKLEFDFDVHSICTNKYVCETIIAVMKKWQAHKAMKAQKEKERQELLLAAGKKDLSQQRIIDIVKRLGVSLGGIGQSDVGYPWLVSLIVTLLLLWLFFVVFG
ncbi:hypothetical protein RFI_07102 [Reticulomyxa filosa]|uniref:Fatty acyl-CoA reductase n=1 Tax=Reticulomyxa filosa TaxID=46433 RepID=X6NVV0_RETFI|nr:hypothetical protein RFI_07102 [Reticulomyxa filosa]|eukprot:ETO30018.1 hypothetical protein RFI_07102 [Reticulomyxa filosa]